LPDKVTILTAVAALRPFGLAKSVRQKPDFARQISLF
jgi:hypothetical protein